MESVDPVVLLSLTTLSGEACHIELPRSATVMVGTQDLKDTDLAADFSSESWCIVFTNDRGTLLEAAQAASQSEEYEEATEHLRDLVQQHSDLTKDENHLLSSVFKAHSGTLRAAWRKAAEEGAATAEAAQLEAWCLKVGEGFASWIKPQKHHDGRAAW
ncbi:unnamed protein product [Symbiodinium natans]|uniref:14-3-3 domain-containing protein n=1 Tax=Symbiodinium natans TaxID=878477 RepID=A0A812JGK5_9DINO|nr:unnamed protein product [Symbiodinium natans]